MSARDLSLFVPCRDPGTILSTYPSGVIDIDDEYINFDSYCLNTTPDRLLSLDLVNKLESLVHERGYHSLRLSLAFVYANLELYAEASHHLEIISAAVDLNSTKSTLAWLSRFNRVKADHIRAASLVDLGHEVNEIRPFGEIISNEDMSITERIKLEWTELLTNTNVNNVYDMYRRLCSINSNEIEGIIKLREHSKCSIVRTGIFSGAVLSTQNGEYRDSEKISTILKETMSVSSEIQSFCYTQGSTMSHEFLRGVHYRLMKTFRFKYKEVGLVVKKVKPYMISSGVYRTINVKVGNIVFPAHDKVPELMNRFIFDVNELLGDVRAKSVFVRSGKEFYNSYYLYDDAYTASCLIHYCFLRIHPFADGNGRVARLISSIPLVMCGLPPVCILDEDKPAYYRSLREGDASWNISSLIREVQRFTNNSVAELRRIIGESSADDMDYMYNLDDVRTTNV